MVQSTMLFPIANCVIKIYIYVLFEPTVCSIINCETESNIFKGNRHANIYSLKFNDIHSNGVKCLGGGGRGC